jgi:hypothetical protein
VHRLDQVSRLSAPEDGVGSVVEVVEQFLDLGAGGQRFVAVVFQVAVAPVQRPKPGGFGVVQAGDRESGPVGAEVLAPRWSAFTDRQMSWSNVAFDANLTTGVLGDLLGTPALYADDVESGKSTSHLAMIAAPSNCPARQAQAPSVSARQYRMPRLAWPSQGLDGGGR